MKPNRWRGPQRRIGLTGGIATGKSLVGTALRDRHGLPLLDADVFAREALAPGTDASAAVLARYGPRVRAAAGPDGGEGALDGAIDRAALGRIIFPQAAERTWLEALVHPLVRKRFDRELAGLATAPAVVLMIPLLFEAGLESLCSDIWLVDCDEGQQRQRLMRRDGLSAAAAQARIAAQWPLARKRELADGVIDNRHSPAETAEQIRRILEPADPGTSASS